MTQQEQDFNPVQPGYAQIGPQQNPGQDIAVDEFEGMIDTYSFGGTQTFTLKDGRQWIAFKIMTEGDKARYQRMTNRDIKINRKTDEAAFKPDVAADRHALILNSVTGWNLFTRDPKTQKWGPLLFNGAMLQNWLNVTDPAIVEDLEEAIRKANPWLITESATVEDIDQEIAELQERRAEIMVAQAGKA